MVIPDRQDNADVLMCQIGKPVGVRCCNRNRIHTGQSRYIPVHRCRILGQSDAGFPHPHRAGTHADLEELCRCRAGETHPEEPQQAGGQQTAEPGATGDTGVQAGQQVFEKNCAVCHNLTAETKVGPGLAGLFEREQLPNGNPITDENLREWITNGGGAMPPVPLAEDELTQVIAFLHEATQ